MTLVNIALYCCKAEIRVPVVGWGGGVVGWGGGWCKLIFVSNPQPSYFGLLLGWVAVAWLGFGVMTTIPRTFLGVKCLVCRVQGVIPARVTSPHSIMTDVF